MRVLRDVLYAKASTTSLISLCTIRYYNFVGFKGDRPKGIGLSVDFQPNRYIRIG